MKGRTTMTETVVVTPVAVVRPIPLRTRIAMHLKNWGAQTADFAKKVGNWFVRGAKWLFSTKPIQWVVSAAKYVAGKTWLAANVAFHYARGPILWIGTPILAFWAMPTTATILLAVGVLALALSAYFTWRAYRHVTSIASKEELMDMVDRVSEYAPSYVPENGAELTFEEPVLPGETVQNRLVFLDQQLNLAQQAEDADRYSEAAARMNLINVRRGEIKGVKSDANLTTIHQKFRKEMERDFPDFAWNWDRMYRGTLSEGRRLKELERLQAKGPLTPVK